MAETKIEVKITNEDVHISKHTLFGMKFPDGTIEWAVLDTDRGAVNVQRLAEGEKETVLRWNTVLMRRAQAALIDVTQYKEGHTIVQREIIFSAGAVEEWGHGGTLPAKPEPAEAHASQNAPWA